MEIRWYLEQRKEKLGRLVLTVRVSWVSEQVQHVSFWVSCQALGHRGGGGLFAHQNGNIRSNRCESVAKAHTACWFRLNALNSIQPPYGYHTDVH